MEKSALVCDVVQCALADALKNAPSQAKDAGDLHRQRSIA